MACPCRFYYVRPEDGGVSVVICACFARENMDKEPSRDGPRSERHEAWVNEVKKKVVPEGVECFDIEEKDMPKDRIFRNAWDHHPAKKLHVNTGKAKDIHLHRMRKARERELVKLDAEWMKATGRGKKADADAIEAKREELRNLPNKFTNMITARGAIEITPEEIHAHWPEILGDRDMSVPE